MIGLRAWTAILFMCFGSVLFSFFQKVNNQKSDLSITMKKVTEHEDEDQRGPESSSVTSTALLPNESGNPEGHAVVFGFREPEPGSIESISLLGERNSGTRWIYGHLGMCFNHTLPVHRSLSRYKHWFQYNSSQIPPNTLVIAMFRDPIEWTWATKEVPHHAPRHLDLSWEEFVTKEWTMERLWKDQEWKAEHEAMNITGRICQENFHYHEVVSCLTRPFPDGYWGPHRNHRFSQHQPFYEMRVGDPRGTPYPNILAMRADKIHNFLESSTFNNVKGFWHYRYESLLLQGTEDLVQKIERATGVKRSLDRCKIYEPQNRRKRRIDPAFFNYMVRHVDWKAEALIGYTKPSTTETSLGHQD